MNLLVPCCRPEAFTEAIHLTVQMLPLAVIHEVVDFVGNHKMKKKKKTQKEFCDRKSPSIRWNKFAKDRELIINNEFVRYKYGNRGLYHIVIDVMLSKADES